jgi:stage II sporulation protein AA (anti-sigma F factor antagonist)
MTLGAVDVAIDHGHCHLVLTGEVDLDNAPFIESKILTAVTNEMTAVTCDLSGITYIDSVGMRVLFLLASRLEREHVPLAIVADPGSLARRVIELSGLASLASLRP